MLAKTTVLKLKKQNSFEMVAHVVVISDAIAGFKEGTGGKIGPKVEICPVSQVLYGGKFFFFSQFLINQKLISQNFVCTCYV